MKKSNEMRREYTHIYRQHFTHGYNAPIHACIYILILLLFLLQRSIAHRIIHSQSRDYIIVLFPFVLFARSRSRLFVLLVVRTYRSLFILYNSCYSFIYLSATIHPYIHPSIHCVVHPHSYLICVYHAFFQWWACVLRFKKDLRV